MKKLFILIIVVLFAFILINRQRVFIRDPLGKVTRGGTEERGTQVFINFSNDVLLENDNAPMYVELIERRTPAEIGVPVNMKCMHWVACLMDADVATLAEPAYKVAPTEMTNKVVTYRDSRGRDVVVTLR